MESASKSLTARQRARLEITAEILHAARRRLATDGTGGLSLRAVARDVGMVSSAVYRYFPSKDALLTALLIEAYDALGTAAESADDAHLDRTDYLGRWIATCQAVRTWAVDHPHEYALLYGTPVIGYAAPDDTIAPATRVVVRLVTIAMAARGHKATSAPDARHADFDPVVRGAAEAIASISQAAPADTPGEVVGRTLMAWTTLFGSVSFQLWGHLKGAVSDHEAYMEAVATRLFTDLVDA